MLKINRLTIINILLLFFSMNFFNLSSWILVITFFVLVLLEKNKIYNYISDYTFSLSVAFAITFFVFSYQNGIASALPAIGCPVAYYIGRRIEAYNKDSIPNYILIIILGMTSHAIINFIYEYIKFGGINSGGIHYDAFSLGAITSATGAATNLTLFAGVLYYFFIGNYSLYKKILLAAITLLCFAYNMVLGGRSFFVLTLTSFAFCFFVDYIYQRNIYYKIKMLKKLLVSCVSVTLLGCFLYIFGAEKIQTFFESTYLFHRFAYASSSNSQDLVSFFTTSDRVDIRAMYITNMLDNLWGGRVIFANVGFYAHELWLDIFDAAGIVPFIGIWGITILSVANAYLYITNKEAKMENKILITGIIVSFMIQFCLEPIITGARTLLFAYFLILGLLKSNLAKYSLEVHCIRGK